MVKKLFTLDPSQVPPDPFRMGLASSCEAQHCTNGHTRAQEPYTPFERAAVIPLWILPQQQLLSVPHHPSQLDKGDVRFAWQPGGNNL
eukprot:gene4765-4936_t